MREVTIGTLITKSIERTKLILFQPFSIKKWLKLLFIALLAGAIGGGSGGNGSSMRGKKSEAAYKDYADSEYDAETSQKEYYGSDNPYRKQTGQARDDFRSDSSRTSSYFHNLKLNYTVMAITAIFVLAVIVLLSWLGARFKFIWFNAIVNNVSFVKEPFGRYEAEGNSLFKFLIILLFVFLVFLGLLVLWSYSSAVSAGIFNDEADASFLKIMRVFAVPLLVFGAGIIVFAVLGVCIDHFVVTIMGMDRCLFRPAWENFMNIVRQNRNDFLLYLLVIIGLGIAAGIIVLVIAAICLLAILIAGGLTFGLLYLLIAVLLKAKIIYIIFSTIIGIPLLAAAIILLLSINLPFAVFFRSFSLYFLSSLDCSYYPLPLGNVEQA